MAENKTAWPLIGMTLDETAESLRVDPKTIRALIKAGDFPARKVGKGYRIDPEAVRIWLGMCGPKEAITGPAPDWFKKAQEAAKEDAGGDE